MIKRFTTLLLAVCLLLSASLPLLPKKVHADAAITINNCEELQAIGNDISKPLNADYVLGGNIDCSMTNPSDPGFDGGGTWGDEKGFSPIGSYTNRFTGTFDGANGSGGHFAINNLYINRVTQVNWMDHSGYNIGLFGVIDEGATVTNLDITNVNISGRGDVGALAGGLVGHVENINATGQVHGSDSNVGGLVGQHVPVDNLDNSSPEVFTWNGQKYTYVADVGRQLPKETSGVDHAMIDNTNLVPKDGKYSMKITQEYNEIVYYDELSLKTFDHVPGYTVVEPLFRSAGESDLRTVSETPTNPLQNCTDMYSHDCKNDLANYDDKWAYEDPSYDNCWTMDFGDLSASKDTNVQLLMRAARTYGRTPASQMRSVSVKDGSGNWVGVYDKSNLRSDGTPRLRSIDLTGKFLSSDYHVKVCLDTYQANYFAIDTSAQVPYTEHTYHPDSAELGYHGFTAIDRTHYPLHDYDQVSDKPDAMLQTQYGNFTKYGSVKPLLDTSDNHFVVMHYGDQMSVEFPYDAPAPGTERSFILSNDAFYKHANLGAIGRVADSPMPYHGMGTFDANTQYPQTPENQAYLAEWNTRHFDGTGRTGGSTIVNSTADVAVTASNTCNVGGMVGLNKKPITGSSATGAVIGGCNVGGMVGNNRTSDSTAGDITDSSATGDVTGAWDNVGGLVGSNYGEVTILRSFADNDLVSSESNYVGGLVGYAGYAQITEANSGNGLVTGNSIVGGLVGETSNSDLLKTFTHASVSAGGNTGGLAGYIDSGSISQSMADGTVEGSQYVGGFVGTMSGGSIEQSYADVNTTGTSDNVGGFVGNMTGNESAIFDSYALGNATGSASYVGGFAGTIYGGDLERDYATGSATANPDTGTQVGAFAGQSYETGTDIHLLGTFATGHVSGAGGEGGYIGSLNDEGMDIANNYFDIYGTGQEHCRAGADISGCTGVNADNSSPQIFKNSGNLPMALSWDFDTVWGISADVNDQYPCLRWQEFCQEDQSTVLEASIDFPSAEDNTPIRLSESGCSATNAMPLKESGLSVQDPGYEYPVGLVGFNLTGCSSAATVTATFTGSFDPSKVTIRKFNSTTHSFTTLTSANSGLAVTTTTFNSKPALQVQYSITDGGPLDEDGVANGTIVDPVGIATLVVAVPNTGLHQ